MTVVAVPILDQSEQDRVASTVAVDVALPVYNEIADLESSVQRLHDYLTYQFPFTFRITIADNASSDGTGELADRLAERLPQVRAVHLPEKGRGRALRAVWTASDAAVLAYMDIDLSTDLAALLPLVAPLLSGHSEIAIGTRLSRGAWVVRGAKREVISRCYNLLLRGVLAARFSDAQCGFKAIRREVASRLLPLVHDTAWFFDTELLILSQRAGLRIHEVPVDWVDDPDSRVHIVSTAIADLKGIVRLARGFAADAIPMPESLTRLRSAVAGQDPTGRTNSLRRQLVRFGLVGAASTLVYLLLYLSLRGSFGVFGANAVALLTTAVANTAANRRLTFNVSQAHGRLRHQLQGLVVFGFALLLTTSTLAVLGLVYPHAAKPFEVAVVCAANLAATAMRFLLLRTWVFHPRRRQTADDQGTREVSRARRGVHWRLRAATRGRY
jgi:putative flippase GtrA